MLRQKNSKSSLGYTARPWNLKQTNAKKHPCVTVGNQSVCGKVTVPPCLISRQKDHSSVSVWSKHWHVLSCNTDLGHLSSFPAWAFEGFGDASPSHYKPADLFHQKTSAASALPSQSLGSTCVPGFRHVFPFTLMWSIFTHPQRVINISKSSKNESPVGQCGLFSFGF